MTFWTWAKGLEDAFDGANRQNLRRFIFPRDEDRDASDLDLGSAQDTSSVSTEKTELGYYYTTQKSYNSNPDYEERKELVRMDSCAVFYKLSDGTGVPHSFVGFIRRWPALPRVVVSPSGMHRLACVDHPYRYSCPSVSCL
jgi:KUP system potassium uptake protein